ncbi:MAG: SRPBCC family protein [Acidimicrobiales bacterium]
MAHYSTTVQSPWDADRAFDYMADLRNFERWDPGVQSSKLVEGTEPGTGAAYDVKVSGTTLRYETLEFDRPRRTVVEANSSLLRSYDVIEVTPADTGSTVRYEATLELKGILQFADPILGLIFNRIGDRAASGMAKALESAKVR